jgi:cell division protein FtsB
VSKYTVALISCVVGCVIGFLVGYYFTLSHHKELESLVRTKTELTQQIMDLQSEKDHLIQNNSQLNREVKLLKAKALNVYPNSRM